MKIKIDLSPFSDLKGTDQQKLAAYYYAAPNSDFAGVSPKARIEAIKSITNLDFPDYEELVPKIAQRTQTTAQALMFAWEQRLFERENFLNSLKYSPETFRTIEEMLSNTPKLWQSFFQIKKLLDEEASTFGDREESFLENN